MAKEIECGNCHIIWHYKKQPYRIETDRWAKPDIVRIKRTYIDFLPVCPLCIGYYVDQISIDRLIYNPNNMRKEYGLRKVRIDRDTKEHRRKVTADRVRRWRANKQK